MYCTSSVHVTIVAWCEFIQPVRHLYSLVLTNAKQADTQNMEVTHEYRDALTVHRTSKLTAC